MTDGDPPDVGADTLDDELVECPACVGTGRGTTTDLVQGNGCFLCLGTGHVLTSRAVAYLDANPPKPKS